MHGPSKKKCSGIEFLLTELVDMLVIPIPEAPICALTTAFLYPFLRSMDIQNDTSSGDAAGIVSNTGNPLSERFIWVVPPESYTPIRQTVVLLNKAQNNTLAKQFLTYLQSNAVSTLIVQSGYGVPNKNA